MTTGTKGDGPEALEGLAVVTGAGGFIGSHLVELLRAEGTAVRAADVPGADLGRARELGCETVDVDLTDPASIEAACAGAAVVFHVAAIFDYAVPWETMHAVNVAGAERVARAASEAGARRLVFFSSVGVYGRPVCPAVPEAGPKNPRNDYERSKWEGEQVSMKVGEETGLEVVAVRPTLVYGPRSRYGHAVFLTLFSMLGARPKRFVMRTLDGGPEIHSVHVDDVVRATRFVAEHGRPGEAYNVADRTPLTLGEFGRILMEGTGIYVARRPLAYHPLAFGAFQLLLQSLAPAAIRWWADPRLAAAWGRCVERHGLTGDLPSRLDPEWFRYPTGDHSYDVGKLAALGYDWVRPDFRDGMTETIRWYQDQRWIPAPAHEGGPGTPGAGAPTPA